MPGSRVEAADAAASRHVWPGAGMASLVAAGVIAAASTSVRADPPTIAERLALAVAYENGEGVPKDQGIAAALYCEAARAGNAEAAFRLGWMYANGRGVAHDDPTAVALFQLAAKRGDAFARSMLERFGGPPGMLPDCMRPPKPMIAHADDDLESALADLGPDPFINLPAEKQKIADLVQRIAPDYGVDPRLALAVITVESNFNVRAHSVKDARGLMQLIPETAARFRVRDAFDVRDNIRGGLAYLRWLLAYYRGQVKLAAAAYNAGERAVDRFRGVPPYPETREYVRRVLRLFRSEQHPYDPSVVQPSAIAARTAASAH